MADELKKLRKLGAQKIHEDTHIGLAHVQSVIHESFESFNKVQFLGFVSILEREYALDLSSFKEQGLSYFEEKHQKESLSTDIFLTPKKRANFAWLYVIIAILIFIVAFYYTTTIHSALDKKESTLDNKAIENATDKITPKSDLQDDNKSIEVVKVVASSNIILDEKNSSNETSKMTQKIDIQEAKLPKTQTEVQKFPKELIISPKSRVWIGYINAKTGVKKQTVTRNKLVLDASKTWLLSFGHTHVNINIDKKSVNVPSSNTSMRFLYSNNELKKLSAAEFKKRNRGRIW